MSLETTIDNVRKWGHDRKITVNGNPVTQLGKLFEEMGEVHQALRMDDGDLLEDAIGDSLVVIIMIEGLINSYQMNLSEEMPETPEADLLELGGYVASDILKHRNPTGSLTLVISKLYAIACEYDLTIESCLFAAYNEIKDRRGYLDERGNFIKESDRRQMELEID